MGYPRRFHDHASLAFGESEAVHGEPGHVSTGGQGIGQNRSKTDTTLFESTGMASPNRTEKPSRSRSTHQNCMSHGQTIKYETLRVQ